MIRKVFHNDGEMWSACHEAETWCRDHGYSVGPMQASSPRGIMKGDYIVAKWRNINAAERQALSGIMRGDMRNGPVFLDIK
jgi:hypothetical protein